MMILYGSILRYGPKIEQFAITVSFPVFTVFTFVKKNVSYHARILYSYHVVEGMVVQLQVWRLHIFKEVLEQFVVTKTDLKKK